MWRLSPSPSVCYASLTMRFPGAFTPWRMSAAARASRRWVSRCPRLHDPRFDLSSNVSPEAFFNVPGPRPSPLGWRYISAAAADQKYKEGATLVEERLLARRA